MFDDYTSNNDTAYKPPSDDCCSIEYGLADINVPIELRPDIEVGCIKIECCGEPYLTCESDQCTQSCMMTVKQRIKVKIPISFGATALTGNSYIECCNDSSL